MKKYFSALPDDIKQTLSSLAVSLVLICGSLFMLSAYMNTIKGGIDSVDAMADAETEETDESSAQ